MSQFRSEAQTHIPNYDPKKQYMMDVLYNKAFIVYMLKGDSVVEKWSREIKVDFPFKNQLLSVYEVISDNFNPDNLGARVYLDDHKYHYIYRGNCEVDRSERLLEYHVERSTDLERMWVKRTCLKSWCKLLYSHCWEFDERVDLYHVFEQKYYYDVDISYEKKKLHGHQDFKYSIGEFVNLVEDIPNTNIVDQVKTVLARIPLPVSNQSASSSNTTVVKTVVANLSSTTAPKPIGKEKKRTTTKPPVKDTKETAWAADKEIQLPDQSTTNFTELDLVAALENNTFKCKEIIPHICNDDDLMIRLISTITMEDPLTVNGIVLKHREKSAPPSENAATLLVAKAILKGDIDIIKVFFKLFDSGNFDLCKQLITCLGRFEAFKSTLCLEKQKISIEDQYNHINKIFTDCIRSVLACEDKMVDDENSRVRKFRELFKLSDVQSIINDRNDRAHSYIKQERIPRALKDRIQCLEEAKSAHKKLCKKKSNEKTQLIDALIQNAIKELSLLEVKFNHIYNFKTSIE